MVLKSLNNRYEEALNAFNNSNLTEANELLTEIVDETDDLNSIYFLAVVRSQLGDYNTAIDYYKTVLEKNPDHPEAHFNLALCYHKLNNEEEALRYYKKAVEVNPKLNDAYNNIAYIYNEQGDTEKAEEYLLKTDYALENNGAISSAFGELSGSTSDNREIIEAVKYIQLGNLEKAEKVIKFALEKNPDNHELLFAHGNILFHLNQIDLALNSFNKALELNDSNPVAYYSVGVCLQNLGKIDQAQEHYKKAIELKPDYTDAINNLGLMYYAKKDYETAQEYFNKVLQIDPEHINAIVNLGSAKTFLNDFDGAAAAFEIAKSIAAKKNDKQNAAMIYSNIGFLLLRRSELDEALQYLDKAIESNPENVLAHYNKAETLLKKGNFIDGWEEYEWRIKRDEFGKRKFFKPLKNLNNLQNKTIFVYGEQGLGDSFHFLRYLIPLKQAGAHIIFECDKSLHELLRNVDYIDELIEKAPLEKRDIDYDYDIPLLSLPRIFGTTLETIPLNIPYLAAEENKVREWKEYFNTDKLKVGIVWAGSPSHPNDKNRSLKLKQLSSLFDIKNTKFYSLQKGPSQTQLNDFNLVVENLDQYGIENWQDTAAIVENLDLLITVDTSVAHLAGAMGKPVWVLLPFNADWRWLIDRTDSPWYPTMRLFRQTKPSDWQTVITNVAQEIEGIALSQNQTTVATETEVQHTNYVTTEENSFEKELVEELIANFENALNLTTTTNVLELGVTNDFALNKFGLYGSNVHGYAIDKDILNAPFAQRFTLSYSDLSTLDSPDESYDLVWTRHTLQKSTSPFNVLKEIKRVLKNGGKLYLEVPANDTTLNHEEADGNYSVLTQKMWNSLLKKLDFQIILSDTIEVDLGNGEEDKYFYFLAEKQIAANPTNKSSKLTLALTKGENFGWGVCSEYFRKELKNKIDYNDIENLKNSPETVKVEGKVFHALKNHNLEPLHNIWGDENYGYTFFEYELTDQSVENARKFDKVLAGSTWNAEKLNEKGIHNTGVLIQGIDPQKFYPSPKISNQDLFVIFSGGKFELRKGQDLVLRAFKILQDKYPDMILINAWFNMWEATMESMRVSPHIKYDMQGETWKNKMINLLQANGINGERVFTLPIVPNEKLREIYQNTDIGLFPNRCEGGTNLVLMEYMACAKPVIASYNTGHKDILTEENSLMLTEMKDFHLHDESGKLVADWKEPSIDEIVAKIEWAYNHREQIGTIGTKAGEDLKKFTWTNSAEQLLKLVYE